MLRRLAAILLIALLAFNWYGYRLLMDYMETAATSSLQAKLDKKEYDESALVEIRVALNMPYISDWDEFQSYEGETEINGIHYKYVKRKVDKGELVLLCIPNEQKTTLQHAKHDFFKLVNDIQQPGKKDSKESTVKLSLSDYIATTVNSFNSIQAELSPVHDNYAWLPDQAYTATPAQPPEA